jgi:HK97 family phage major capsid protein
MKTVEQLEAELRNKTAEMKALNDKADFNAEDQTKLDAMNAKGVEIKAELKRARDLREWELTVPATQSVPSPASTDIHVGEEKWKDDPKKGFKTHAEFLQLVMQVPGEQRSNAAGDPRLRFLATAGSDEQSTFSSPYGGFFVPEGFLPGFLSTAAPDDPIGSRTRKFPMTYPVLHINARVDKTHSTSVSGGLRVYRRAEADTVTASREQFEQIKLEATALMGINYQTEELIARSPVSFAALVAGGFRDEFTSRLAQERISGTGVGQFQGVTKSPALITVTQETGQAADTVVFNNILKMAARVWGYDQAIWLANATLKTQLPLLSIPCGAVSVPLYTLSRGEGFPDMLWGRPIVYNENMAALGDANDLMCVNWNEYLEGTLTNMQQAESIHVRFVNHERTFKFWMENDARGWWTSVLTPKNGDTLSPFVALGAR